MSTSAKAKEDYDTVASTYNDYADLPSGIVESQLIEIALGDCTGLKILDLAGGTGRHAREAVELGASRVDIVDISPGMLNIGQDIERSLGREDKIRFLEADVSKPFPHLGLQEGGYDIVMGNWVFSTSATIEALEGIFRNIALYLKPGGKFVGVRDSDPISRLMQTNTYGASIKWLKEVPGGYNYLCVLHCNPPIEFEAWSLKAISSGSTEMYEKFGLANVETIPYESAEVVRSDPDFWEPFTKSPILVVVKAFKQTE